MENKKVTSIEELREIASGKIIPLPPFFGGENETFNVRVKRPSILGLMESGKIPNNLKAKVEELFSGTKEFDTDESENLLGDMYKLAEIFARETLVEPTYQDLEDLGITLTDEQLMVLMNFAQQGMAALGDFRKE